MAKKYTIQFEQRVEEDLKQVIRYYNKEKKGLGTLFYSEFQRYISRISKNPLQFQLRYLEVHIAPLKKFPFLIFYTVEKNQITVLAVAHSSMDSEKWPE